MPSNHRSRPTVPDDSRRAALVAELAKLDPDEERSLAEECLGAARETVDDMLGWLQAWYASHCNDDWEYQYGVSIETLDNPGWSVKIDLTGTPLAGLTLEWVQVERTETDWIHFRVDADQFYAAGGARNLKDILRAFRTWVEQAAG